jgi:nitroimidazol reductase NimA-like FMN-containing flavoprotein (pyridoxamine 5'-phosphate oxidase superfamily)
MNSTPPSDRAKVRRLPQRGVYDAEQIYAILDQGLVCHLGFVKDGQPFVIPTLHVRVGNKLYLHGSPASRMLKTVAQGVEVCVTVTLIDGLVLARSAFHHSVNYRSVVVFGTATVVSDLAQKFEILHALTEHLIPGRWRDVRTPSQTELQQTLVLELSINEASAKVRTGPPLDDEPDYALDSWAGVVPLSMVAAPPIADPKLRPGIAIPRYAARYEGPGPAALTGESPEATNDSREPHSD